MTEQELQEIKERLKAINGEDWFVYNDESAIVGRLLEGKNDEPVAECWEDEDAQFIAHAPEDIHRLLDEVERLHDIAVNNTKQYLELKQENERLRKSLEEIHATLTFKYNDQHDYYLASEISKNALND